MSKTTTITTSVPRDPAWDQARATAEQLRTVGRSFLRGQVQLGMQLSHLKQEHGKFGSGRRKKLADSATLMPWPELVEQETGYSRRSADVFIKLFDASLKKLKTSRKLPASAKKNALTLFNPETAIILSREQWVQIDDIIATLTDGETQATLMQELGVIPKPKPMPKPKGKEVDENKPEVTAGQFAIHFFEGLGASLINTRTSKDYLKLLNALPENSSADGELSLSTLETEARNFLADIEDIKSRSAKAAKGKVINS